MEISAFSNATTNFMKYEQSYVFPHAITALAPTSTKFGITTRDLIGLFAFVKSPKNESDPDEIFRSCDQKS